MNVLMISENAFYNKGGAERSLKSFFLKNFQEADRLTIISSYDPDSQTLYSNDELKNFVFTFPKFKFIFLRKVSPFLQSQLVFLCNVGFFIKILSKSDVVLTQNRWAPYTVSLLWLIQFFGFGRRPAVYYFIRDEKCVGFFKNYAQGIKKYAWLSRHILEAPSRFLHIYLVRFAFSKSKVIFNSQFMYELSKRNYLRPSCFEIIYPIIEDIDRDEAVRWAFTQTSLVAALANSRERNVVMVGDDYVKGIDVTLDLGRIHTRTNFIIFSKKTLIEKQVGNIIFLPWSNVAGSPFVLADTVIVPSRWLEAFGRVVVEAKQFGCNILVSDVGGLVEALGSYDNGWKCSNLAEFSGILYRLGKL